MTVYVQDNWALHNDDADHDTSTIIYEDDDTIVSLDVDTIYQARQVAFSDDAGSPATNEWQYSHNSGTWTNIPAAGTGGNAIESATSAYITNDDDTTQRISSGTYISTNGCAFSNDYATANALDFTANSYIESVITFKIIGSEVSDGDTIELRFHVGGATISGTVDIDVNKPAAASRRIFITG